MLKFGEGLKGRFPLSQLHWGYVDDSSHLALVGTLYTEAVRTNWDVDESAGLASVSYNFHTTKSSVPVR